MDLTCCDCGEQIEAELLSSRANQAPNGTLCEPCRKDRMMCDAMDSGICGDAPDDGPYAGPTAEDLFTPEQVAFDVVKG